MPRLTMADPRLDAARGAVAIEYGPLVYCLEAVDNPGHRLDDLTLDTAVMPKVASANGTLEDGLDHPDRGPCPASDWRLVVALHFGKCVSPRRSWGVGSADCGAVLRLGKPRARRDADLGTHRVTSPALAPLARHSATVGRLLYWESRPAIRPWGGPPRPELVEGRNRGLRQARHRRGAPLVDRGGPENDHARR